MEEDPVLPDQLQMQQAQLPQQQQHNQQQQEPMEPGYLSIFLLKFMCPKEGCFGTMAAVQGSSSGACECSVCGTLRSEAEFLAELEQQ
jgi:SET and MYND domain-containing protein